MVKVTKEEVMVLREKAPSAHIAIVNRQSSHKKYYAEENRETIRILRELRGEPIRNDTKKQSRDRHRGNGQNRHSW